MTGQFDEPGVRAWLTAPASHPMAGFTATVGDDTIGLALSDWGPGCSSSEWENELHLLFDGAVVQGFIPDGMVWVDWNEEGEPYGYSLVFDKPGVGRLVSRSWRIRPQSWYQAEALLDGITDEQQRGLEFAVFVLTRLHRQMTEHRADPDWRGRDERQRQAEQAERTAAALR